MKKIVVLLVLFTLNSICSLAQQVSTCNVAQINAAMNTAGFLPLNVPGYPCALYFYNPTTTSNWNTAQSQASAVGATLLTICNQAENDAVLAAAQGAGVTGGLWIGYSDGITEGTWNWMDGSTCNFTNWNPGEPSNSSDLCSSSGEDVAIMQMSNGKWNDVYTNPGFPCVSPAQYASLIKVNLCPQVTPVASAQNVCQGDPMQLTATTILGSSPYTYSWVNPSLNQVGTGSPFTYNPASNIVLTVVATDQYACSDSSQISITTQNCTPQQADNCCPYNGWDYTLPVTITNNTPLATTNNLQTLLILDTQTPISQNKMQASGNDIRFIQGVCTNELPHYVESGINTNQTNIWVKLPTISPGASLTIYLKYGNATAASSAVPFTGSALSMFPSVLTVTGTQNLSGTQNFDWINVQAGATVNMTALQPVILQARRIIFNGSFNGLGQGFATQNGPGAGGTGSGSVGGGGGGYGSAGGGGGNANGGPANGTANGTDIAMGSGGGNSDCNGAAGGGALTLTASVIDINGAINVNGNTNAVNCGEEAGGGGAGGGILVFTEYLRGNGTLEARGGKGENSTDKEGGGGGAGGRIKIFWSSSNTFSGTQIVTGGVAGSGGQSGMQPGGNGTTAQPQIPGITQTFAAEVPVSIPNANFSAQNACVNTLSSFNDQSSIQSGGSITQWSWDFGDGSNLSNSQNPTHPFATAGTYDVTLTITSSTGCTSEFTSQVTVNEGATAGFTSTNVCIGTSVNFINTSSLNATSWNWNFGDGTTNASQTATHNYTAPGTYTVTITVQTANGCISIASNPVTIYGLPNIQAGQDVTICAGQNTSLTASGGTNYTWTPTITNGQSLSPTQTTTYSVVGIDANGCQNSDNVSVMVLPLPTASISANVLVGPPGTEVTFTNASTNATNYNWNFGNGSQVNTTTLTNQTETFLNQGIYTVTLTASNGFCDASQNLTVTIIVPLLEYFVPNVFTVTGDNVNESWTIQTQNATSSTILIFNRWGNLIVELKNPNETWDGTVNGKEATSGVYFYKYEFVDNYNKKTSGHGHFTLIRK